MENWTELHKPMFGKRDTHKENIENMHDEALHKPIVFKLTKHAK